MRHYLLVVVLALASARAGEPAFQPIFEAGQAERLSPSGSEAGRLTVSTATFTTPGGDLPGLAVRCSGAASNPRNAQLVTSIPGAAQAGDTLWIRFWLRTASSELESGEGRVQVVVENGATFEKSAQFPASTGKAWKEIAYPFTAKESFRTGSANLCLRLGYQRQDLEIAGLEIRNYARAVHPADLPLTKLEFRYEGMQPDAPWRAEAEARIDRLRKAPLTVRVVDASGHPVGGASVEIAQTRHEYLFGSAVNAAFLAADHAPEATIYRDVVRGEFNAVTFENDLKWSRWLQDRETPLAAAAWCGRNGIVLRGHTMVWPSWRKLPPYLKTLDGQPEQLRAEVMKHIREIGQSVGSLAAIWDVLNEPFANHDLMDLYGDRFMVDCFNEARQAAPGSRLFINDFGIVTDRGLDHAHQDHYEKTIAYLQAQQAPLNGIGIQGHFGQELTAPLRILEILNRFGAFHLPIQMTEFSLQIEDRSIGAAYLRDVMTVFFSHPSTNGFLLWGFHDGPGGYSQFATLYDQNWTLTPCGQVWHDLVFGKWWTRETVQTPANGEFTLRGFRGQYIVSVRQGDQTIEKPVRLGADGAEVTLKLAK